jgi:hypothetical protein
VKREKIRRLVRTRENGRCSVAELLLVKASAAGRSSPLP